MRKSFLSRLTIRVLAAFLILSVAQADDTYSVLSSVSARTNRDYKRKKGPDGKWVREYYAMTNGGAAEGTVLDNAQEKVKFVALASVLAEQLARQGYFPATDPNKVDLLIVVNWGRTTPFNDSTYRSGSESVLAAMNSLSALGPATQQAIVAPATQTEAPQAEVNITGSVQDMQRQAAEASLVGAMMTQDMFNRSRDQANEKTARLLGYTGDINKADGIQRFAGGGSRFDELIADIEEARYYVILTAYDFNKTVRQKDPKVQWITRMSMRASGNSFAEKAAAMVAYGASRFGQNTDGVDRQVTPAYKVNLGDLKFLGVADKSGTEETKPDGK